MHGIPSWLGWVIEYWPVVLELIVISVTWIIGAVVFLIKGWTIKTAIVWPYILLFIERSTQ